MRRRTALAIGTFAAALIVAPPSQATLTLGPDLNSLTPASSGYNCSATHECTLVNGAVGAALGSPPLVSPVTGSIQRLRLRTGPGGASGIIFRLLRPTGGGAYRSTGTFGVVPASLPPNSTTEFPPFPIEAGEAIGIDCCRNGGDYITTTPVPGSGSFLVWGNGANPPLGGNEERLPDSEQTDQLLMLNADIEPFNMFGVKAKLKGAKVRATATVFNTGVLTATGKLLRRATVNVKVPTSGGPPVPSTSVRIVVKAKKTRRAQLRRVSRAHFKIAYTPIFGTTSTAPVVAKR